MISLPDFFFCVQFDSSNNIRYIYDANGVKLASLVGSSSTYYRSVMTYARNGGGAEQLLQIGTQGGMIAREGSSYVYKYLKTDHLGSTRVVLAARAGQLQEEQRTDYYPYGLSHSLSNLHLNKFLFSGKELQDANIGSTGMLGLYDFHARYYNPFLGRWFNIDPALQFTNPYMYCGNSPQMYIDPDGRAAWVIPMIIGAAIGGSASITIYTVTVAFSPGSFGNWDWGQFFKNLVVGSVSGAAGGAAGAYVGSLFSVSSGALYGMGVGAASGLAGGFTGGSLGAWWDGASLWEGTQQGLMYGAVGAAAGALAGGATEGIRALNQGRDFWTGAAKMQPGTSPLLRVDTPELDQQIRNNANGGAERRIDYKPAAKEPINYPPNQGFQGTPEEGYLMPGDVIDRYGAETGRYFTPQGTPVEAIALPPGVNTNYVNTYEVVKPFPVKLGPVAPAFGQPGGGTQYIAPLPAQTLKQHGFIQPVK